MNSISAGISPSEKPPFSETTVKQTVYDPRFWIVIISLTFVIVVSGTSLLSGVTIVFPHLFYVPILLAAYWYPRKGIAFSLLAAAIYFGEVVFFVPGPMAVFGEALIRCLVFVAMGTIISYFRNGEERYRKTVDLGAKELKKEKDLYRAVVESQTELVCRFLPDMTTTFVNDAYCRYFGKRSDEIIGTKLEPDVFPEDRGRLQEFFDSLTPENPIDTIVHRIIMPDGSIRWQNWIDQAIFNENGNIAEYQSVGRDFTEFYETREALEKSETQFRSIAEQSSDIIIISDKEGNATFVSPSVTQILGYKTEEFLRIKAVDYIHPDDHEKLRHYFVEEIGSGHSVRDVELRCVRKNGTEAIVVYSANPIYYEGTVVGDHAVGRDITLIREKQKELEHSLEEKTLLLQEVHHRVKNTLAIVASIISLQMNEVNDPILNRYLQDAENRIIAIASVHEALYHSEDLASIDMCGQIDTLCSHLTGTFTLETYVTYELHCQDCILHLDTAVPLSLIINELLTNSMKYAFQGRDKGKITVCFDCSDTDSYCLRVSDDGVGLGDSFDPTDSPSLGIELMYRILKNQLKGEFELRQENGTTWIIRFPKK